MNNLDQTVQQMACGLGLDGAEIIRRKRFLELSEGDVARLRKAHELLRDCGHRFADAFYEHLADFEFVGNLLKGEGQLVRLKKAQAKYFDSLTAGEYGPDYVNDRLRVGVVHQRIGLEPKWYLGAYRKYLSEMQTLLWGLLGADPREYLSTYDALLKVVNFDIGLALDTYFQAAKEQIQEQTEYAEKIVFTMPSGLMVVSEQHLVLSMNPAIRAMLHLDNALSYTGVPLRSVIPGEALQAAAALALAEGEKQHGVLVVLRSGGHDYHLEFSVTRIRSRSQALLLIMAEDITARVQAKVELAHSEERYRLTFSHAAVGMAQATVDGRLLRVNQKLCQIMGYEPDELVGMMFQQLTHPDDVELDLELAVSLRAAEIDNYSREKRYLHKAGHVIWANVTVSTMRDARGRVRFISVFEDISQRKRMEQDLRHLASHDALTNLPNRTLLLDRLSQTIALARRSNRYVAVLFIDLDRFKHVNDSLGHVVGDFVLSKVADILRACVRCGDTVARLGGDEFVIVLGEIERENLVAMRIQTIFDALAKPIFVQGAELYTAASIGAALYPKDGRDGTTLMKNADAAMYRAKQMGRNNFQFYASEMNDRSLYRLGLASGLRHALERGEFALHYQPKTDIASGRIVGMEALLRWRRSDGVTIPTDELISIAEETGLIIPIGSWVLQSACKQIAQWRREGALDITVAVNLSVRQFKSHDIVDDIAQALRQADCPASALELEITESVLMDDPESMVNTLRELSDMGVYLSIDDFGTGYSSLNYLKRFPIHALKIDQSFVRDIATDEDDAAIVKAVIGLAHCMQLKVVAEGVETAEQLAFLGEHGCDQAQGYFISKPVPADQAGVFLFGLLNTPAAGP